MGCIEHVNGAHMMSGVEEKVKGGGGGFIGGSGGTHTTCLLEDMKLLKEMQDHSGLFLSINKKRKNHFFLCFFWKFLALLQTLHNALMACLFGESSFFLYEIGFW